MTEIKLNKKVAIIIPDIKEVTTDNIEIVMETALAKPDYIENLLLYFEDVFNPSKIAVKDMNDETGLAVAEQAKKVLRSARNRTKDICFASREELNKKRQESLDLEKGTIARIQALEDHVDAELEKVEAEKEKIRVEDEAMKKLPLRTKILTDVGIVVEDESTYKYITDIEFMEFFNVENQKVIDAKAAKQKELDAQKEKDDIAKQAREDALANAAKELRIKTMTVMGFKNNEVGEQFVFTLGETTINASYPTVFNSTDEQFKEVCISWEKTIHESHSKKADLDAKANAKNSLKKIRISAMSALGFLYSEMNKQFIYQNMTTQDTVKVLDDQVFVETDDEFDTNFAVWQKQIDDIKIKENNKKTADALAKKKQEDEEAEEKKRQQKEKDDAAERARQALLPDKQRLTEFVHLFTAVVYPTDIKSAKGKAIVDYAGKLMESVKAKLIEQINLM